MEREKRNAQMADDITGVNIFKAVPRAFHANDNFDRHRVLGAAAHISGLSPLQVQLIRNPQSCNIGHGDYDHHGGRH